MWPVLGAALAVAGVLVVSGCGNGVVDLHSFHWADATVPGSVCGTRHAIHLHNNIAVVSSTRWPGTPRVTVYSQFGWKVLSVVYGDLDGDGNDEAALAIVCNNGGETADGNLGYAQVIFTAAPKAPRVIGIVTPQERTPDTFPPFFSVVIKRGKIISHEFLYAAADPSACCPTGRATTVWVYAKGQLRHGRPRVEKRPR